jgi:hypothetical protein
MMRKGQNKNVGKNIGLAGMAIKAKTGAKTETVPGVFNKFRR